MRPDDGDYFVLKPKHSAFFSTPLDVLLKYLGAQTLILTGLTTDMCVLFTACDAYMRDYHLVVPGDCNAAMDEGAHRDALTRIKHTLKADIRPSSDIDLSATLAGEAPATYHNR